MRKKLDTRFPAARIKKIMQTDEDVGKIAMAVPLLVSKALELFLQDLCDRTYEITVQRGAKTVNSLHLKQCVQSFNVFDFLREIVNKVPDLGGSELGLEGSAVKRRKVTDDEENDHGEEIKKETMNGSQAITCVRGRGRGRGRGKGRGRGSQTAEKDSTEDFDKLENVVPEEAKETVVNAGGSVRNFDLNMDLDENGNSATAPASTPAISSSSKAMSGLETKYEEYPGWSLDDMANMGFDPVQLANFDRGIDEEDEDYDDAG